jgi:ABC-2 type transport system ATP-binding protein
LAKVEGVSMLSQSDGLDVSLQVEGEMDGLIKALAAFPVREAEIDHPSLEEIFLAYYETGKKEAN